MGKAQLFYRPQEPMGAPIRREEPLEVKSFLYEGSRGHLAGKRCAPQQSIHPSAWKGDPRNFGRRGSRKFAENLVINIS